VQSPRNRCGITAVSLRNHREITAKSLRNCCAIDALSPRYRRRIRFLIVSQPLAITTQSRRNRCANAVQFLLSTAPLLLNKCAVVSNSLRDHFAIAAQLLCNHQSTNCCAVSPQSLFLRYFSLISSYLLPILRISLLHSSPPLYECLLRAILFSLSLFFI
jgi:hypothetical protein